MAAGLTYLQHLTDDDLALLALVGRVPVDRAQPGGEAGAAVSLLRSRPDLVERLLADPAVFTAVFRPQAPAATGAPGLSAREDPLARVSPFLTFALAVQAGAEELRGATSVQEWLGPRQRIPVLDVGGLRDFVSEPMRRLFLVELLASYTHVASGSVVVQTNRGMKRRRFSELDPVRMASLLEIVPESDRAGIYRRLGDLALFLTGVFPDHTAVRSLGGVDQARLLRSGELGARTATRAPELPREVLPDAVARPGGVALLERLGARWYQLAVASAPPPLTGTMQVAREVAERFQQARRVLNHVTERFLLPLRTDWAPPGT